MADHYETLEVSKTATDTEIKSAYRRLAMKYHPDRNKEPGAEEKFKAIQDAYDCLSDTEKRRQYDQSASGVHPGMADFFGGGFWRSGFNVPVPGDNLIVNYEIDLKDILQSQEREVSIQRFDNCDLCGGKKTKAGTSDSVCASCGGTGSVERAYARMNVQVRERRPCTSCNGRGRYIPPQNRCERCNGEGKVLKPFNIRINIPAGVDNDRTFLARQQGHVGANGGGRGDVFVRVSVRPHPKFKRVEGSPTELVTEVPISYVQACLGARVDVETISGEIKSIEVPKCCQPGTTLRVEGYGVPPIGGGPRGVLHAVLILTVPKELTAEQQSLIEKLADIEKGKTL